MKTRTHVAALAAFLSLVPGLARSQYDASEVITAPSEAMPAPPAQPAVVEAQAAGGQWVYTEQYGWIWMPYSDAYMSVPADGYGQPYQYVYYPAYSAWTWVVAPWIWGIGPWPYFGAWGPVHYAWYGHGWWRTPHAWHYGPRPFHGGYAVYGARPVPYRGGYALPHVAAPRGGAWRVGAPVGAPPRAAYAPRSTFVGHGAVGGGWHGGAVSHGAVGHARGGGHR